MISFYFVEWGIGNLTHFVSEIFVEPERWELRGDPLLWRYLKNYYMDIAVPYPLECLEKDILRIFKDFTGEFPVRGKHYFVKDFSKNHIGMSTGYLSANFWLDEAIPLLVRRLEYANTTSHL